MLVPGLKIDQQSATPVYRQIADGIVAAARDGRLHPGHQLPPTRDLARHLGVNRQTVVNAYEYLASRRWVRSHTGKGTFLALPAGDPADSEPRPATERWLPTFSRSVEGPNVAGLLSFYRAASASEGIPLAGSYPARELMPVEAFGRALAETLRDDGGAVLGYGPTAGHPALRELIAASMHDGAWGGGPESVLVTNGAQQGIDLVCAAFLERDDAVVIEEPTYTGALSALASIGARVVAVQVDEQGMRPDSLAVALERNRPRLMYVQPSFHNPTGAVMGEARRRELLALAARSRCMILEDDWAAGLRFEGDAPPTLHALDGGEHVIYLSTFSKKLMPGLRIGWVAARPRVMKRLVALKQIRDCGTSPLLQAALFRFLRDGGMEQHLARVLPAYRRRRDRMDEALRRHLPRSAAWSLPAGAMFLWVTLPAHLDTSELADAAREAGVLLSGGQTFHVDSDGRHAMRLTYSAASLEEIDRGVEIVGRLVRERWPAGPTAVATADAAETLPLL